MADRKTRLDKIKSKPDTNICTCGLKGVLEFRTCTNEGCQVNQEHQKKVNELVENGWLPVDRWRHT